MFNASMISRPIVATGAAIMVATLGGCQNYYESPASEAAVPVAQAGEVQLAQIMDWWPGDYNNDRQVAALEAEGKPIWREDDTGEGGHIEVTSHYRQIDLPEFGENVLYVEETKHGDPNLIFRQRIYSVYVDEQTGKVRVELWSFKDREKYVGAWRDLSKIKNVTKDEMSTFGYNCELVANPQDGKYHIAMNGRDCAFGENYFSYQVLLGPDSFWFRDKISRVSDDVVITQAGNFTYHELDRVGA